MILIWLIDIRTGRNETLKNTLKVKMRSDPILAHSVAPSVWLSSQAAPELADAYEQSRGDPAGKFGSH